MNMFTRPFVVGAFALSAAFGAGSASAETTFDAQTFSYAAWTTPQLGSSLAILDLFKAVTERTGGKVTFEPFWNGALCGAMEALDCVSSGQIDIVFGSAIFNPAELPLTTIASVPFQTTNPQAATNSMNALVASYEPLKTEWARNNAHLLWFGHGALPLLGTTKPIEKLSDVRDMALRTVGYTVRPMAVLGANSVATAPAEQYEALQRGVVQGVLYTSDGFIDSRLYEVITNLYDLGEYMGVYAMLYNAVNKDVWDGMKPELQAIFTEEATRIITQYQKSYMQPFDEKACEVLAKEVKNIGRFGDEASSTAWAVEQREAAAAEWMGAVARSGVAEAESRAFLDAYRAQLASFEASETDFLRGGQICINAKEKAGK